MRNRPEVGKTVHYWGFLAARKGATIVILIDFQFSYNTILLGHLKLEQVPQLVFDAFKAHTAELWAQRKVDTWPHQGGVMYRYCWR